MGQSIICVHMIVLLCEIQIGISVIIIFANTTGILNRLQNKQNVTMLHTKPPKLPLIVQIIIVVVIAFLVSTLIRVFLNSVM